MSILKLLRQFPNGIYFQTKTGDGMEEALEILDGNRSTIWEKVKKAMSKSNVPAHIIDDTDIQRVIVDDFTIDEGGNILTKGETPQSVENYITAKQKEKPHWAAPTVGDRNEQTRSSGKGGATAITDEEAQLMNLEM
jgi:hypothetical protein